MGTEDKCTMTMATAPACIEAKLTEKQAVGRPAATEEILYRRHPTAAELSRTLIAVPLHPNKLRFDSSANDVKVIDKLYSELKEQIDSIEKDAKTEDGDVFSSRHIEEENNDKKLFAISESLNDFVTEFPRFSKLI
jgi:hypothetical protein